MNKQTYKRTAVKIKKTHKGIVAIMAIIGIPATIYASYAAYKHFSTKNIDGEWKLRFVNESSSYKPYIGETHTQKISFTQNDFSVSGDGEKWEYNDQLLPFNAHRKLEYTGSINGSDFNAKYVLHGERRESNGHIKVKISDDGDQMEGTFVGTAGDTKGRVTGERID